MALTAILTNKRDKNLDWIIWSLTAGLRSYSFCKVLLIWNRFPFVQKIVSSENLDKAPQLQSQKTPDTQTPTSPASHHYHKGTNFTGCREPQNHELNKKIQEFSKIMSSFNNSYNFMPWTMFSSSSFQDSE